VVCPLLFISASVNGPKGSASIFFAMLCLICGRKKQSEADPFSCYDS
jgi:hypothetical protein